MTADGLDARRVEMARRLRLLSVLVVLLPDEHVTHAAARVDQLDRLVGTLLDAPTERTRWNVP